VIGFLIRSIPRRTLAALLTIYFATYVATAAVVYSGVRASMLESDASALNQLAELKYEQLASIIGSLAIDLTAWSELDVMNDLVSGDIDQRVSHTLEDLKRLYGLPGDIYAFDATGKRLASSNNVRAITLNDRIPAGWQNNENALILLDRETDPITRSQAVVFAIPVFGSFDKSYRTGTLVMTYPWASIEALLLSGEAGMVLVDRNDPARILATNRYAITGVPATSRVQPGGRTNEAFVIGRSAIGRGPLIKDWQVVAMHRADVATGPLRRVVMELVLLGAFLGIPIIFLGRWLSNRLTAPIADLTRVVKEIADTDKLDARVPVNSSDELGSLAQSFNLMTEKLEQTTREREQFVRDLAALNQTLEGKIAVRTEELKSALHAQQRLIGDISHEIKSPLARLSMALGLARRAPEQNTPKQFDRIETEIENISALASELLTLAKLEGSAASPDFAKIDLRALVAQIVADARFEKPSRSSDVVFRMPNNAITVIGNGDLLRRAIENVVRNALFYTSDGISVDVILAQKSDRVVCIQVQDKGLGVPEAALGHLFEPFYRVDEARARETGGTGIGLSICERVIRFHGGSVCARNSHPHGLIIEMELPSAAPTTEENGRQSDEQLSHGIEKVPLQSQVP